MTSTSNIVMSPLQMDTFLFSSGLILQTSSSLPVAAARKYYNSHSLDNPIVALKQWYTHIKLDKFNVASSMCQSDVENQLVYRNNNNRENTSERWNEYHM